MKPPEAMSTTESRRYGLAYNAIILTEQPFITPTNPLEEAMVAMAKDPSREHTQAFETVLLRSKVYVLTNKEGLAAFKADPTKITFSTLPVDPGQPYAMVLYTSRARLHQAMHNDTRWYWLSMPGRTALATGRNHQVALNYGLRPPVYIEAKQVTSMLARTPPVP
ncbi:SseB protein N-terminal domain-containing protein [Caulobacter sp. UNC279MFTsu5.1]|nr:SseB protein N-terminal domain-containing protein [Caulobacter sp. UNC279MFTsu5.1]